MKVKILTHSSWSIEREINESIEDILTEGNVILDIKFTETEGDELSVMIIYCNKADIREQRINNLLVD